MRRVERQIGAAGFEGGEHGDQQVDRARQQDGDRIFRPGAQAPQDAGQRVGALCEITVGKGGISGGHGERRGMTRRLSREDLV